ncbi:MAG: SecDF P1 head subdomain-containing protein, partial [Thermomonas sp.]
MLEFPRWKYFVILLVLALSVLYALPNIYQKDPSVQITPNRGAQIDDALKSKVVQILADAKVTPKAIAKEGDNLVVRLNSLNDQTAANNAIREQVGDRYTVALNLASTVPAWLSRLGGHPMVLGLDLVGGVHFALQVDKKAAVDKRFDAFADDIRTTLRDARVAYRSVERSGNDSLRVVLANPEDAAKARAALVKAQPTLTYSSDATGIVVGVPQAEMQQIASSAIEQNLTTLRNRVNELGVAEPIIQRQGDDRIVVELPGVQDTAEAKRMIGATATLEYRAVVDGNAQEAADTGRIPPEAKLYRDRAGRPILLNKRVIVTGDQMVAATVATDQNGMPAVSVTLNGVGGQRMFDFTSANVGKPMAVVYTERIPQVT